MSGGTIAARIPALKARTPVPRDALPLAKVPASPHAVADTPPDLPHLRPTPPEPGAAPITRSPKTCCDQFCAYRLNSGPGLTEYLRADGPILAMNRADALNARRGSDEDRRSNHRGDPRRLSQRHSDGA